MVVIHGKNALIVGGLGGMGQVIASKLIKNGLEKLAIIDIADATKAQETLKNEFTYVYHQARVDKKPEIEAAIKNVVEKFGKLDIFINSAGILNDQRPEDTIAINFGGTINCTTIATELMRKDRNGSGGLIINIASVAGIQHVPLIFPVYAGTKHAIVGFTRSFVHPFFEKVTGISYILICPGNTDTQLVQNNFMVDQSPFQDFRKVVQKIVDQTEVQSPEVIGDCVIEAIEDGANGSIWVSRNNKNEKVTLP